MRRASRAAACALALLAGLGACQREEKIINYKPFFAGLEGVSGPGAPSGRADRGMLREADEAELSLVRENPDGSKTLILRNGRDLIFHIRSTLAEEEVDLFTGQVLSRVTHDEFIERGRDPAEAFWMLKKREQELAKLFARMPMGEHSPSVLVERIGHNLFRVRLTGQSSKGLDGWRGFDMVLEEGKWRLRWMF